PFRAVGEERSCKEFVFASASRPPDSAVSSGVVTMRLVYFVKVSFVAVASLVYACGVSDSGHPGSEASGSGAGGTAGAGGAPGSGTDGGSNTGSNGGASEGGPSGSGGTANSGGSTASSGATGAD